LALDRAFWTNLDPQCSIIFDLSACGSDQAARQLRTQMSPSATWIAVPETSRSFRKDWRLAPPIVIQKGLGRTACPLPHLGETISCDNDRQRHHTTAVVLIVQHARKP
jgi:hypothetical protein